MTKTRKILIALFCFFILFWGCEEFFRRKIGGFAGSYPFVEYWNLKITEPDLIEIIKEVKTEHPELHPPNDTTLLLGKHSYWFFIDFYYQDTKEIVNTWTRSGVDSTTTTIAFVSLSPINNPQDRKLINRDFWYLANKLEIRKFKRLILEKIQEKINQRNLNKG